METPCDQPDDWTERGAYPVVPGVHRIPLALPLDGLTAVNCYVFEGPQGLVLVDPGWAGPETERTVRDGLAELGHSLDDIAVCVATHHHWDHYTQAYAWRETLGSELVTGREERHSILDFSRDTAGRFPAHADQLAEAGAPDLARRVANAPIARHERDVPYGPPDDWLHHGDRIPIGDGALEVVATPGHTRGHVVLRHTAYNVLVSGDHILPRITPSLGFEWSPEAQPLRSFLRSLELVLTLPDAALLPAHGPILPRTHDRVREQLRHHDERLSQVREELCRGAETAYDVARALPWTRTKRTLEQLPLDHQMIAVTEIRAHLEVLRLLNEVDTRLDDGERRYWLAQSRRRSASVGC